MKRTVTFTVEVSIEINAPHNTPEDVDTHLRRLCADTAERMESLAEDRLNDFSVDGHTEVDRALGVFEIKGGQQ